MQASNWKQKFETKEFENTLKELYVDENVIRYQQTRYQNLATTFIQHYQDQEVQVFSAAGRSEVGGNHTDHQKGCVLAASINLDAIAMASKQENTISIISDGMIIEPIDINQLQYEENEKGTSKALVKGVVSQLEKLGYTIGGFKAYITSDVLIGAGLSSSAAFETLIGTIISGLYNQNTIDMVTIAKAGQYAENVYFGKPCGLMDQCACAVGGLINIDFKDTANPIVRHLDVDFSTFKHSLCIVDTKGSHADLTEEYAAIPVEMKKVANYFGKEVLREVDPNEFFTFIQNVRQTCSDRPTLRALHFFLENERVEKLVQALNNHEFETFKQLIQQSGNSSYKYLQNVFAASDAQNQAVSLGLAMSEHILQDHGVCRVHGGGFAGTIQAFVEDEYVQTYKEEIEKVFGKDTCHILKIRKYGGYQIL